MAKKKRIKKIIGGVAALAAFFKEDKIVLEEKEILSILPHRGRMLFLNKVTITDKKISGEFKVTKEVCEGHEFNGQLIFRGVDIIEMAAQVLGVWLAQHPESEGKIVFFRKVLGDVKFFGMVVPSDILVVEISVEEGNPKIEISGRPDKLLRRAVAKDIIAKVGNMNKAVISGIEFSIIDQQSLAE